MTEDVARSVVELQTISDLPELSVNPDYTNRDALVTLRRHIDAKTLTLVVGAGISKDSGLPEWVQLIRQAADQAFADTALAPLAGLVHSGRLNPLVSVRFLEHTLGLKGGFRSILTRELYKNLDIDKANPNLDSSCELVLGSGAAPAISEIITYNFDDVFERKLKKKIAERGLAFAVHSVYSDETYRMPRQENSISIYHVHGFLPSDADWAEMGVNPIVFSEPDFHEAYFDHLHWANEVQRRAFVLGQCLFVGLSMTDPNLRRLLDQARRHDVRHYGFLRVNPLSLVDASGQLEAFVRKSDFESLKVAPVWIAEYGDISVTLAQI